jgi:putative flavoprotein involved in K+ transport
MKRTETLIIGAGQAGLAMSRALADHDRDHVVLERGQIAQRWTERWDSLRLLTPNWMNKLPGWRYAGIEPDGYMQRDEVVHFLGDFAGSFEAPVQEHTTVLSVRPTDDPTELARWRVDTDRGPWLARNVVVATGHCAEANVPECAGCASPRIRQVTTLDYRNPAQLPSGGVLVVGASASGVQLADELRQSGRRVVLAVGNHNRLPRRYRGHDILRWLDRLGTLDREIDQMRDVDRARREPSLQLVGGGQERGDLDLAVLAGRGVELAGRLLALHGDHARFAGDLRLSAAKADVKLRSLLQRIDRHITEHGLDGALPPAADFPAVPTAGAPSAIDLEREGIRSILWATGYRRSYSWLEAPVLDARGEIVHWRGRTPAAGLYALGLQFMIRRRSSFIGGVGLDALELVRHIVHDTPTEERAIA